MKKIIICLMMLCSFGAYATGENERVTSMGYVTEELDTRQDKFDKLGADTAVTYSGSNNGEIGSRAIAGDLGAESNTSSTAIPTVGAVDTKLENKQDELDFAANTVLMNTGVAGEPAAKGIYQSSGDYNTQADSLVDAATFNAALQNAINSELSCAQRKDPNDPTSKCLLFNIFAPTQNLMIPNTYTRLEYLESTGTQCINTGKKYTNNNFEITWDAVDNTTEAGSTLFAATAVQPWSGGLYGYANARTYWIGNSANKNIGYKGSLLGQRYTWKIAVQDTDHSINLSKDGNFVSSKYFTGNVNTTHDIYLFCGGWQSNADPTLTQFAKWRLYNWQFRDNGVLVFNGIPAKRNSDGELGIYDTVSGTFKINAGTGTFIAGPELSSNIYLPMN